MFFDSWADLGQVALIEGEPERGRRFFVLGRDRAGKPGEREARETECEASMHG